MEKNYSPRREFIKHSAMGIGGMALSLPGFRPLGPPEKGLGDKHLSVLCLGAHPGDPEFGCGATMAKYSDLGHSVTFLYLTRGEASDPSRTFAEMATLRTKEAESSCRILHANPLFAGQIDGNTVLNKEKTSQMSQLIRDAKPDIVFSQWPVDAHPDHQVTGLMALNHWIQNSRRFHLYFYEVNTGTETMSFTPTNYVDISDLRERKKEAMFCHKTQAPEDTYHRFFKPLEEFRGLEAGVEAAEAFVHFSPPEERVRLTGM
jgi:LmbE family N-acetylglucosaminyl deacetylase